MPWHSTMAGAGAAPRVEKNQPLMLTWSSLAAKVISSATPSGGSSVPQIPRARAYWYTRNAEAPLTIAASAPEMPMVAAAPHRMLRKMGCAESGTGVGPGCAWTAIRDLNAKIGPLRAYSCNETHGCAKQRGTAGGASRGRAESTPRAWRRHRHRRTPGSTSGAGRPARRDWFAPVREHRGVGHQWQDHYYSTALSYF